MSEKINVQEKWTKTQKETFKLMCQIRECKAQAKREYYLSSLRGMGEFLELHRVIERNSRGEGVHARHKILCAQLEEISASLTDDEFEEVNNEARRVCKHLDCE